MKLRLLRKFDFTKEDDWFRLIEFVFKTNIVCVCLVYPFLLLNIPGTPGTINGGPMTSGLILLALNCFLSGLALLGLMIVQLARKKYRCAAFDLMFAILAMASGALMMPPSIRAFP